MATIGSWRLGGRRVGAVAAGATIALALAGCDESSPSAEAIDEASIKLEMLAVGGGDGLSSEESLRSGYNSVLTTLGPAEKSAQGARSAAAALIAAQAHLGLASVELGDALAAELACSNKQADVRNLQNNWTRLKSLEQSLLAFDPAEEIERLEQERTARAGEIADAQERLSQAEAELDQMGSEIASLEEQARSKWQEETQVRQDAIDMDEVDRAPLVERANEIKRVGDGFDRQASEMKAVMASEEPGLRDIEADIQRATIQSERLTQNIDDLRAQHAERRRLAGETAEEAATFADQLARTAGDLEELRKQTPSAWQGVIDACDAARSKASAAARERGSRDAAQVQVGAAEQMRADSLARQADGAESYASTLELLGSTPDLPGAEEFTQAAAAVRQQAAELRQMAAAAYGEAANAFEGVNSGDELVKGALEDLTASLREKAGVATEPDMPTDETGQEPAEMPADDAPAAG